MATSSLKVAVHPLVAMNMSDQYTRTKVAGGCASSILGVLLGNLSGLQVEVCNSFDLKCEFREGEPIVDMGYLAERCSQYQQVFKTFDVVGWYCVNSTPPGKREERLIDQLLCVCESPILLQFDPESLASKKPIITYESLVDLSGPERGITFIEISDSTLATEEAERICVDHVAKLRASDSSAESSLCDPMSAQHGAIKMLLGRVLMLLEYVEAVKEGSLPFNMAIIREISSLCNQLPVLNTLEMQESSSNQHLDVLLMTHLATITKSCAKLNEFLSKFNIVEQERKTHRYAFIKSTAAV